MCLVSAMLLVFYGVSKVYYLYTNTLNGLPGPRQTVLSVFLQRAETISL